MKNGCRATQQSHHTPHRKSVYEEVKYKCNQCDFTFIDNGNLRQHIPSKHEGLKYGCNQCDYRAYTQSDPTRHIHYSFLSKAKTISGRQKLDKSFGYSVSLRHWKFAGLSTLRHDLTNY